MPSSGDHEQEHNAANYGDHKPTQQGAAAAPEMPVGGTPPQPPQPPRGANQPDDKPGKWRENTKLAFEAIGLTVLIAYTIFSCLQWLQLRWTNRLTREALDGTNTSLQQTLTKMQGQIDATTKLYGEAQKQTQKFGVLAANSGTESTAAKSAADTAKNALHVSERAYINVNSPQFEFSSDNLVITFINIGHIPSGALSVQFFEASYSVDLEGAVAAGPNALAPSTLIERHWHSTSLPTVAANSFTAFRLDIPAITADGINSGHQMVRVGIILSYNDGFPDTPVREQRLCQWSVYDLKSQTTMFAQKDPVKDLNNLIAIVGYPQNEEK